jgi:hypothetical protein
MDEVRTLFQIVRERCRISSSILMRIPVQRRWKSPGGLRGLQNRQQGASTVLGGFDSHAPPPPTDQLIILQLLGFPHERCAVLARIVPNGEQIILGVQEQTGLVLHDTFRLQ